VGLLIVEISLLAGFYPLKSRPGVPVGSSVTVQTREPGTTSQFAAGLTYTDTSLDPSGGTYLTAPRSAQSLIHDIFRYQNTNIMGWGMPDPWPDPALPGPTKWQLLDSRLHAIIATGGIPVISLSEAPWWMKGSLQADGRTQLLTYNDEWADIAYSSRVLDNKLSDWLLLVQTVAERYMAPPYNVRYFQVWNELKGYYNPMTNNYDYSDSPGNPAGPNARHGFTYMYNLVYQRLMQTASGLGISPSTVKIGGPYVVLDTWSSTRQGTDSHVTKAYGTFDQRSFDVLRYWLQHKDGAGFIAIDSSNENRDFIEIADPFTAAEKFADIVHWLRSLDEKLYPGVRTLPIWLSEWYAVPYSSPTDVTLDAAVKAYALALFTQAGGAVALSWGWQGDTSPQNGLWTPLTQRGGQPLPWYNVYFAFQHYFSSGAHLYTVEISDPSKIGAIATHDVAMLINKTGSPLQISLNGRLVLLAPYQVQTWQI
jgi:hypothetical protein